MSFSKERNQIILQKKKKAYLRIKIQSEIYLPCSTNSVEAQESRTSWIETWDFIVTKMLNYGKSCRGRQAAGSVGYVQLSKGWVSHVLQITLGSSQSHQSQIYIITDIFRFVCRNGEEEDITQCQENID